MKVYAPFYPYHGYMFDYLSEIVRVFQRDGNLKYHIDDIVMYNIRFRDCLREKGIEGVIQKLIDEAPMLANCKEALDHFRSKWLETYQEHIADYDIQCLPTDSRMYIEGEWFDGISDVNRHLEMYGKGNRREWRVKDDSQPCASGLHVGNIYDSMYWDEFYTYNNWVFSKQPITESLLDDYCQHIPYKSNYCMVTEYIPERFLPILYRNDDSSFVLLATRKY